MRSMVRRTGWMVAAWGLAALPWAAAAAQSGGREGERATAFRAAGNRPPVEEVPGGLMMVLAYAAIWLLTFAFVWRMARRQAALERTALELERRLRAAEGAGTESRPGA